MTERGGGYRHGPKTTFSFPLPDDAGNDDEIYAHWIGRKLDVGTVTNVEITKHRRTLMLTIEMER